MASKRPPLSFPEFEGRGRQAILRSAEEVRADEELLENQHAGKPAFQQTSTTDENDHDQEGSVEAAAPAPIPMPEPARTRPAPQTRTSSGRADQHSSIPAFQSDSSRTHYIKATYRLSPAAIDAIEDAKRILRRQYNLKANLEEIAEQAILAAYRDLLEHQQASNLARQLARKPGNKKARKPALTR